MEDRRFLGVSVRYGLSDNFHELGQRLDEVGVAGFVAADDAGDLHALAILGICVFGDAFDLEDGADALGSTMLYDMP